MRRCSEVGIVEFRFKQEAEILLLRGLQSLPAAPGLGELLRERLELEGVVVELSNDLVDVRLNVAGGITNQGGFAIGQCDPVESQLTILGGNAEPLCEGKSRHE